MLVGSPIVCLNAWKQIYNIRRVWIHLFIIFDSNFCTSFCCLYNIGIFVMQLFWNLPSLIFRKSKKNLRKIDKNHYSYLDLERIINLKENSHLRSNRNYLLFKQLEKNGELARAQRWWQRLQWRHSKFVAVIKQIVGNRWIKHMEHVQ